MKFDINGNQIPNLLIEQLEIDWEDENHQRIEDMKLEGKTFDDFLKSINIYDYYDDDEEIIY